MTISRARTLSEGLFESYLRAHGHPEPEYEPDVPGTEKHPDYRLTIDGRVVLFDVKQLEAPPGLLLSLGHFDPYTATREKINEVQKQFRGLRDYPCALVLFNAGRPLVDLDPEGIYAAMLGDVVWRIPFEPEKGLLSEKGEIGFGSRGKMIWYKAGGIPEKPVNTTISAIVVLAALRHGYRRLQIARKVNDRPTLKEELDATAATGTERDTALEALRVVVHENPFAASPLPAAFGRGTFDERYGPDGNRLRRVFVGDELARLETEETEAGIEAHDPFGLRG